ncbi:MAG: PDR/VanB family oxidoreductase [Pseudomonadota bacterium]
MTGTPSLSVRVAETEALTPTVRRIRLVSTSGAALPLFSGGSHVVVNLPTPRGVLRNPYSLTSCPTDGSGYEICVQRSITSRGGSLYVHEALNPGDTLDISYPVNLFPLDRRARKHLFVAGGIGITPFLAMMQQLAQEGGAFELHYAMRSPETGAARAAVEARYGTSRVRTYVSSHGTRISLPDLLEGQPLGTHLYVCGPSRLIDDVLLQAREAGWPDENVHSERFAAPPPGKPFVLELARSGRSIQVGSHQSVLEAIEAAGLDAPNLCRGGACGQCETGVVACDGALEHHDHFLTPDERAGGRKFMICISRIAGERLVLDL